MPRLVFIAIASAYWLLGPFSPYVYADDLRGGDAIVCEPTRENGFAGMYSLDYLLTYNSLTDNSDVLEVSSVEVSLDSIANKVRAIPKIYNSMRSFIDLRENHTDRTQERVWEATSLSLVPIADPPILRRLPANCYNEADATANIIQAIEMIPRDDGGSTYLFAPEVLNDLEATSPLQLSFMLTHEWLWDFTDDALVNRRATRFLHSTASAGLSADDLQDALEGIGLVLITPVCRRSETMREAIERTLGEECHEISPGELTMINELRLLVRSEHLRATDFEGLVNLYELNASRIGLQSLPLGLEPTNISRLDLSNNNISAIPEGFLEGYYNSLSRLNLSHNQLETFTYIGSLRNGTYEINVENNILRAIRVHNVTVVLASGNLLSEGDGVVEFENVLRAEY